MKIEFKDANKDQLNAINSVKGPLLIIAGPGTGKTKTLIYRIVNMIVNEGIDPLSIMVATFTEKAAKELLTRLSDAFQKNNIDINLLDMYVGTLHSLCLRLIKENISYASLDPNYNVYDDFQQKYLVFNNLKLFEKIENIDKVIEDGTKWSKSEQIIGIVSSLEEECVDKTRMSKSSDVKIKVSYDILVEYEKLLVKNNALDFSKMQVELYNMLNNNQDFYKKFTDKIKYVLVDEYQDTNYIQEQLVLLMTKDTNNLCVVGDDDQSLYRFRGATVRNILEFEKNYEKDECKTVYLTINYRSNKDIIDFYNSFMSHPVDFSWGSDYRYEKKIIPNRIEDLGTPTAIRLEGENVDDWCEKIYQFILNLKTKSLISDYNQIAFLFKGVRNFGAQSQSKANILSNYLEKNGINVYSPRSDLFFERDIIKLFFGLFLLLFPNYIIKNIEKKNPYIGRLYDYYVECLSIAKEHLEKPDNKSLKECIGNYAEVHTDFNESSDYNFIDLMYEILSFSPFSDILSSDLTTRQINQRDIRNLSILTNIIRKYHEVKNLIVFEEEFFEFHVNYFFSTYMYNVYVEGIDEYEDDSEYAPSGAVSFMTIHQSKGMEFPIVFVDSLLSNCKINKDNEIINYIEEKGFLNREEYEPYNLMKYFDYWRLYYTAFSRAQDLLILTCSNMPNKYFKNAFYRLPSYDEKEFNPNKINFNTVKDVNILDTFSFTTDISAYEVCPRQYKFLNELGFANLKMNQGAYGTLVHETIEDIHKLAIDNQIEKITEENITKYFTTNYETLSRFKHAYFTSSAKKAALREVLEYVKLNEGKWDKIKQAEVEISLVKPKDYVIKGVVDLVKGEANSVEIIDFKTGDKPDKSTDFGKNMLKKYENQLNVYAHLIEQKNPDIKVSGMKLYFTGENDGNRIEEFTFSREKIDSTMNYFDDTVKKIQRKDFTIKNHVQKSTCNNCGFQKFCNRTRK